MDHVRFNNLKLQDQLRTVAHHGTLLYRYKRYNLLCRLYGIQNLYVEVIANYQTKEVVTITAYDELDHISHILEKIDISGIYR